MTKYLLDANIFIQAKNFEYAFSFCQGFWQWIEDGYQAGVIYSTKMVLSELNRGADTDEAKIWANNLPGDFFLDDKTPTVMAHYSDLMKWADSCGQFKPEAVNEFASVNNADPFLIAAAKSHGYDVVTQENNDINCKKRVLIPVAAAQIGVNFTNLYELLRQHACGTFNFCLYGSTR